MSPVPSHPVAAVLVVMILATTLAWLAPRTGVAGLLRNFVVAVAALCTLLLFGATIGKILGDFLRE